MSNNNLASELVKNLDDRMNLNAHLLEYCNLTFIWVWVWVPGRVDIFELFNLKA